MEVETAVTHQEPSGEKPSQRIINRIADLEGIDPTELTPPLYSKVDPEALDSLFRSPTSDGSEPADHICFRYCGYEIRVESNDHVSITEI